jgi:hypothetical protein
MPGCEKQRVLMDYLQVNPTAHKECLVESIRKQIEKSNLFEGNIQELDLWFDLLSKIIMLDYRSRLTAKQALEHPFFS